MLACATRASVENEGMCIDRRVGGARIAERRCRSWIGAGLSACALVLTGGHLRAGENPKPAAASDKLDFVHEVVPILQKRCAKCHAGTQKKGGFSINTRQSFLSGGDDGPAVVPRDSANSALVERVAGEDADLQMPPE